MPKGRIAIDSRSRKYWTSEFEKYLDVCTVSVERMPTEQRRTFTHEKGKLRNDLATKALLIDQARLVLEEGGFSPDEIECCVQIAPAPPGEAPVLIIDKLAAHYLYSRMTGQDLRKERTYRRDTLPIWQSFHARTDLAPDVIRSGLRDAVSALTPAAHQMLEKDKSYSLNTMQAKLLLRQLLKVSQNTLGKILNKQLEK